MPKIKYVFLRKIECFYCGLNVDLSEYSIICNESGNGFFRTACEKCIENDKQFEIED